LLGFGFAVACALIGQLVIAAPVQSAEVPRIAEPLVKPAFTPLRPGAVEPAGWLRDWALAARNGITGHLDEYTPTFHDAWKGPPVTSDAFDADATGGPLEQCSYWLDGALRLGYILHDDALIKKVTDRLNPVVDGVNHGGRSFIYWKKEPPQDFNSWAHSQMGRALVGWYEASGESRIRDALVKVYRRYPTPMGDLEFADGLTNCCPTSGLCNLDAMLEAYSFSGDPRLLERIRAAIAAPEVQAAIERWLKNRFAAGHAVCAYELIRLPVLFYLATGDRRYLQASCNAFRWLDENHMLPYGVASGEEHLSGIGAFRLTETCNVTADIWSMIWLYRTAGRQTWGDRIEQAFFNAAPAPIARDFQTMCYYQSPNRILGESLPGEQPKSPGRGCLRFTRLAYPHVLCCVGAVNRILPSYIMHMWMATGDGGLAATLYGPCSVSAMVGAKIPVKLTCETAYPFEEAIRVTVDPEQAATFPLYFRVPAWCGGGKLAVNGASSHATADANGFLRLERQWKKGDTVTLTLPMSVRLERGFETEYPASTRNYFNFKSDVVFQRRRLPYESVHYGPLLLALAIPDKDPNTPLPGARWQYALANDAGLKGADIKIERKPMPAKWDWPLDAPLVLTVPARIFDWKPSDIQPLPAEPVEGVAAETIRLVPYGCTKFRISMFPVTKKAWARQPSE
jgi:hypothetical protein